MEDQLLELQGILDEWKHRCMVVEQDMMVTVFRHREGNAEVLSGSRVEPDPNQRTQGRRLLESWPTETVQRLACKSVRSAVLMTMSISKLDLKLPSGVYLATSLHCWAE